MSFSYNSFVKFHGKSTFVSHNMTMLYLNLCYKEVCYNKVQYKGIVVGFH